MENCVGILCIECHRCNICFKSCDINNLLIHDKKYDLSSKYNEICISCDVKCKFCGSELLVTRKV